MAHGQTLEDVREQMRTGKKPAARPAGPPEDGVRTTGVALMIAGALVTAAGMVILVASSEGHSPFGGCNDCGPGGQGLGMLTTLGGLAIGTAGVVTYAVSRLPPAPPVHGLAWSFRFRAF
jgi:hypothetical protein